MSRPLRILVGHAEQDPRPPLLEWLSRLGHTTVGAADGRQLVEQARAQQPDLIITDVALPGDPDGLAATEAAVHERATPVLLLAAEASPDLLARVGTDHVMGLLVGPLAPEQVAAAVAAALVHFAKYQQAAELQQTLEERKVIERAKGSVMRWLRVDEEEAFLRLKHAAWKGKAKLIEAARQVLAAEEVFRELDNS
jgi:response regulator NasT